MGCYDCLRDVWNCLKRCCSSFRQLICCLFCCCRCEEKFRTNSAPEGYEDIDKAGDQESLQQTSVFYCNHQDELRAFSEKLSKRIKIEIEECETMEDALKSKLPLLLMFRRKTDRPLEDVRRALENVADEDFPAIRLIYIHNYSEPDLPVISTSSKLKDEKFCNLKGIFDFAYKDDNMLECELNDKSSIMLADSLKENKDQ